jgi:hypothetical protein
LIVASITAKTLTYILTLYENFVSIFFLTKSSLCVDFIFYTHFKFFKQNYESKTNSTEQNASQQEMYLQQE